MLTVDKTDVEARLDRIESMIEEIHRGLQQAPSMLSMATDSIDELIAQNQQNGVDLQERTQDVLRLLVRLTDPGTLDTIHGLLDFVDQAPGLVSMAADSMDDLVKRNIQEGINIQDRTQDALQLLNRLTDPGTMQSMHGLLDFVDQAPGLISMTIDSLDEQADQLKNNELLKVENIKFMTNLVEALVESKHNVPERSGGIFRVHRKLKDPDRQRALAFLLNLLKNIGQKI